MRIEEREAIRQLFTGPPVVIARMAQANRAKGRTLIMVNGMAHSKLICKVNSTPRV
jgi:hypothetical protein